MTEHEWAQYIQEYKPQTESETYDFMKTLLNYSKQGNIEAQISEFRALGIGRGNEWVKEIHEYKQILRNAKREQHGVQEGFIHGNSNAV